MITLEQAIKDGKTTTENALYIYDALEPIPTDFLIGSRWKGSEFPTDHQMDGFLAISGWYGKWFIDPENAHPLLFYTANKKELYPVSPDHIPMAVASKFPKFNGLRTIMLLCKPFLQTKKSKARLRMVESRGKSTATMIYDRQAINDSFRKIDENRVMGVMDLKGIPQPYFFLLTRDDTPMKINV